MIFILSLIFTLSTQTLVAEVESRISSTLPSAQNISRQELINDIQDADFVMLSKEEFPKIKAQISNPATSIKDLQSIKEKLIGSSPALTIVPSRVHLMPISPGSIQKNQKHTISQLDNYIQNRIGSESFKLIKSQKVEAIIIGGFAQSIGRYLQNLKISINNINLDPIPNLYEKWGIYKYLITPHNPLKKSKVIWIIPPALEYLRHYATMLNTFSPNSTKSYLDEVAESYYEKLAQENAQRVKKVLSPLDYIAFGYESSWLQLLLNKYQLSKNNIKIISNLFLGVTFKLLSIPLGPNKKEIKIGFFSSDQTIWGELASRHLNSFLSPDLKAVLFFGSAGATSKELNVYDISILKRFSTKSGKLSQRNYFSPFAEFNLNNSSNKDYSTKIHSEIHHGNTYSPMEQNKKFLKRLTEIKIQSVDVEQSLIAETIEKFNQSHRTQVQFGAINLITDKPYTILESHTDGHQGDLDNYDKNKKANTRQQIVNLAWEAIQYYTSQELSLGQSAENNSFSRSYQLRSCKNIFKR